MRLLYIKYQFFLHCLWRQLKIWSLCLGSHVFSTWYYIDSDCICTTGKVLKLNNMYTYKEGSYLDIVRLFDVHIERGYLYCSLYFFSQDKIITVCQILQKDAYALWRLMDDKEYGELMSRKSWYEVTRDEELLEFDF
jgi:hypothetical protein